ncbi:MAG: CHAD domain-containing protein, partial [Vicinamibacterales bacterium]
AAQCLVLERYEAVSRLHESAVLTATPTAWHELRVAVKRFRYGIETVFPARLRAWENGLRHVQDLLGEIHDLDLLDALLEKGSRAPVDQAASLRSALTVARRRRIDEYCEQTVGAAGLLETWRHGLPRGSRVASAVAARLKATAHAADAHPTRTTRVMRLASRLFEALAAHDGHADAAHARAVLRAAGQLHAIRAPHLHSSKKRAASSFVRQSPLPPGWTLEDWEMVSLVVRYHRGAQPSPKHRRFARLPNARQDVVRGMAGILRLGRELDRQGATTFRLSASPTIKRVWCHVPGLECTRGRTARIAVAQRLLETYLGRPLVIAAGTDLDCS